MASSVVRRRCPASAARGKTSPIRSTRWRATSRRRSATSPKSPSLLRAATFAQDHRRRARRNSAAQGSHQYDGGPAAIALLPKSRASPARSAPKGSWAVRRLCRALRYLEGSHRLGQRHGRQPHRPGPQHRRSHHRCRARRPSRKITVDVKGEILELKDTINTMVDQLNAFAGSDPRRARGRHRRQTRRSGAGARRRGTWKDLTDNVNFMASNLTGQCATSPGSRRQSRVATCQRKSPWMSAARFFAQGNPQHDGGSAERFAGEVTRVAREVGKGRSGDRRRCWASPAPGKT